MQFVKQFIREEEGQDVVEYGLLIAAVSLVILGGTKVLSGGIETFLGNVTDELKAIAPGT
jgi:Flp pilus assembly pilin Flp